MSNVRKVWHLGVFMIGFMAMIFSAIILPMGSSYPTLDIIIGLVGIVLVLLNARAAMENTPVSLGCLILMFGLAILALGAAEVIWYSGVMYHTGNWIKFCLAVGFTAMLGTLISWFGFAFIIKQMKKQGLLVYDEETKRWKTKNQD